MSRVDWLDVATKCFTSSQSKESHVNDLAKHAQQLNLVSDLTPEEIAIRLSAALSKNVIQKSSRFSRVKNKQGGYRKGIYKIRAIETPKLILIDDPVVSTGFTGKAGEHAVLSELLFRGYNASIMSVDQGIDVVASKNNKYFHIQVKTANGDDSKPYTTAIRREAFQFGSDIFYIIVLHRRQKQRYINDYVVLSSGEINQFVRSGKLKDGITISLRITVDKAGCFSLNDKIDVTHCVNYFDNMC